MVFLHLFWHSIAYLMLMSRFTCLAILISTQRETNRLSFILVFSCPMASWLHSRSLSPIQSGTVVKKNVKGSGEMHFSVSMIITGCNTQERYSQMIKWGTTKPWNVTVRSLPGKIYHHLREWTCQVFHSTLSTECLIEFPQHTHIK